ncbi:MAG: MliC family protein [Pseudorhodoplanes sp.]
MRFSLISVLALGLALAAPASAQTFLQYRCENGAQLSVAFVEKDRRAFLQLDGKSLTLPQSLSGSGARYAKGGVKFWIKGNEAQLKRPKSKWTQCKTAG